MMPDLHDLLTREANRLGPGSTPPFARLEARARRRRRAKIGCAATASVAVVAALAIGLPHLRPGSRTTQLAGGGTTAPASRDDSGAFQATAAQVATQLSAIGAHDPRFASVAVDAPHNALMVHRKGGGPSDAYPKSVDGITIEFGPALLSQVETNQTMDSIWAARPELEKAGIIVTAVTTDGIGAVQVQVRNPSPSVAPEIAKYAPLGASSFDVAESVTLSPAGKP